MLLFITEVLPLIDNAWLLIAILNLYFTYWKIKFCFSKSKNVLKEYGSLRTCEFLLFWTFTKPITKRHCYIFKLTNMFDHIKAMDLVWNLLLSAFWNTCMLCHFCEMWYYVYIGNLICCISLLYLKHVWCHKLIFMLPNIRC